MEYTDWMALSKLVGKYGCGKVLFEIAQLATQHGGAYERSLARWLQTALADAENRTGNDFDIETTSWRSPQ